MGDFVARLDPTYGALPPALKLIVSRYRSSIWGGPESCEIVSESGPEGALWETLGYVFRGLEIYNDFGTLVWWGFVNSVVVNTEGIAAGVTLDDMYNRIKGVYSYTEANGATNAGVTAWQEESLSIGIYGYKEYLLSVGEADETAALAEIAHLMANGIALPQRIRSVSSEGQSTKINGVGWWETLRWRYFSRLEGRIVWLGTSGQQYTQNIGWMLTSNRIGFAVGSIHDMDARISALQVDDKVVVSGSASNNKVLTIAERASGAQQVYTANTVRFEPTDDILDSASGLGFVEADNFIQVQGSVLHSRYHLIDTTGADHITVAYTVTGALSNEAAGPSITITQGQRAITDEAVTNESPGAATVTLLQYGAKVAQRFTADHAFTVDKIALSVGKVGSPADSLRVSFYSDVLGAPGSSLLSTTLAAASIATQPTWTWFSMAPATLSFVAGTSYWVIVERTGAASGTDYFTLRMIAESYGTCLAWNGGAWVTHPQVIDGVGVTVPFQIWGAEDTLLQLKRVITDAGQWFAGIDDRVGATGRLLNQYVGEELEALDVAEDLISKGMSDGRRIFITVTPERVVRIEAETTAPDLVDRWMRNGKIGGAVGGMRERGTLPVGEWLALEAVPVAVNSVLAISPAMVDAAEYSPPNDEMTPEWKSLKDDIRG